MSSVVVKFANDLPDDVWDDAYVIGIRPEMVWVARRHPSGDKNLETYVSYTMVNIKTIGTINP